MAGLHLEKGAIVEMSGRRYTCTARGPGGAFLLAPHTGRSTQWLKPETLFDLAMSGGLKLVEDIAAPSVEPGPEMPTFQVDLSVLEDAEKEQVLKRHYVMQALEKYRKDGGSLSNHALDCFANETHKKYVEHCRQHDRAAPQGPMSAASIRRWYRRWVETGGKTICLAADARGNAHSKLTLDQQKFLQQAMREDYLTTRRLSARKTHTLMTARINIENRKRAQEQLDPITPPSYNTLCRHIAEMDLYEVLKARYNAAYAAKVTRHYGTTPPTHRHLQCVQADHTPLDIYCDLGGGILVRPTLTMILDQYSKAILGYWLSPDPACAESVMQALRMAVLPKNVVALGGQTDWPWPMHGLPLELIADNGKDFLGTDLDTAASDLEFTLSYAPPKKPYYKAQIERKFGEVNASLLAMLPGQVFKYEPEKHGLDYPHLTLDEFHSIFLQWVTTELHRTPGEDGYTPEERWLDSVQKHGSPGSGFSQDYIHACISKFGGEQPIHSEGILFNSTCYKNGALTDLKNRLAPQNRDGKVKVRFKWSAHDVGYIWVLDPLANLYFRVESSDKALHGRSLFNHRVILREQRNRKKAKMSDDTYTDAVLALDQRIKEIVARKKPGSKTAGARLGRYVTGAPKPKPTRGPTPKRKDLLPPDELIVAFGDDLADPVPASAEPRTPRNPEPPRAPVAEVIAFADELEI